MKQATKGALLAIAAAFFYSMISVCVKWIGNSLPTHEIVFFRALVMLLAGLLSMKWAGQKLSSDHKGWLVLRGISGAMGAFTYYAAVARIPLAETMALVNLSPFVVTILAGIFLKEGFRRSNILGIIISFAGAIFVINPGFATMNTGILIALASAFITGCSNTLVRKLRTDTDTPTIVFYYNIITIVIFFPAMLYGGFVMPSPAECVKLVFLGASSLLFNYCNTASYKYAHAGEVAIYTYFSIIFSSMTGFLIWGEIPALMTVAGVILIIGGAYISFRFESSGKGVKTS